MSRIFSCINHHFPRRIPFWHIISRRTQINSNHLSDYEIQHKTPKCIKAEPIPLALYGGRHTVTLLPGTGVGPELLNHVQQLFKIMGAPVDFEVIDIDVKLESNTDLEHALISIKRNGVAIKGNVETKCVDTNIILRNVAIRNHLDLYVFLLWCRSYPAVPAKHKNVDIVLIRQNIEGEYSMLEHSIGRQKVVESMKVISRENSRRVATYAFEYARKHNRKKIATVHKASMLQKSDGLFLDICNEVAKRYPDIEHTDLGINHCCRRLISSPQKFDVILTTNLYGSVLANIICGINGGPGLYSGRNYGDHYAVFETATRNTGSDIEGKNRANPVCFLNAAVDMLYHLGHHQYAKKLEKAIFLTLDKVQLHTPDIGGHASTTDVINNIIDQL